MLVVLKHRHIEDGDGILGLDVIYIDPRSLIPEDLDVRQVLFNVAKVFAGVLSQAATEHRVAVLRSKFVAIRRWLALLDLGLERAHLW